MHIDQNLHTDLGGEDNKGKTRNYVWCNIGTAIKQNFVAHQFKSQAGSAYNTTQMFEYEVGQPVSEEL